jgi:hypothetical protein
MFLSSRRLTIPLLGALTCSLVISCSKRSSEGTEVKGQEKPWNQSRSELEYKLIRAELQLAESKKPYFVIDFKKKELELKLEGALVWNYSMDIADTSQLAKFAERFMGVDHSLVRPLMFKYLFSSATRTPDSILEIVSSVTMISPDLMQRTIPSRFQLKWSEDVVLDVRTDVVGKPESKWKNTIVEIRQALSKPFGDAYIEIKMPKDNAITLYRAAQPGLQTLIYPAT